MKHTSTRAVFAHWNEKRGNRAAPGRGDIDPVAIAPALGDTFMLAADFVDQHRFRLAGTRICALFCREIKGEILSDLLSDETRKSIEEVLSIVTGETTGVVTGLVGYAEDGTVADLEMLLLPLARTGHARTSVVGVLAPATPLYWIGVKPIVSIELRTVRHLGPDMAQITPRAAVEGTRMQHGFTVYTGGRAESAAEQSA